ncbi:MAG: RnfABCDGE type electron transport complex subunit D, partial [Bacillota bacterium]
MANSYEFSGPHVKKPDSVEKTMWNVVIALLPAMLVSVYLFGNYALYLIGATVLSAVIFEIPFNGDLSGYKRFIGDGSAVVTGVILALSLPPNSPWWLPVLGGALAIIVGKQLFGGIGNNIFNPALVARAILAISWPIYMTQWVTPFDGATTATPLMAMGSAASYWELFIGTIPGSLGETSAIALLIGAAFLYVRGYLDLRISLSYVAASALTALLLGVDPIFTILSGALIFGAFFIATDMVSSPTTKGARIIYGIGCGALTVIIRVFTALPEGVTFAILLMNGFSHLLDTLLEGYIFGEIKLKEKRALQLGSVLLATVIFAIIAYGGITISGTENLQEHNQVFQKYMENYFPKANQFNILEDLKNDKILAEVKQDEERLGFLAYVASEGYGGKIKTLAAINLEGALIGSKIVEHNESSTLGARVAQQEFLEQFEGVRYEQINPRMSSDFDLDVITNATLSSNAVVQSIDLALELVQDQIDDLDYDHIQLPNGKYYGTGNGMWGPIEVEVIVQEGFLQDINIIDHQETPQVAGSAFSRLKEKVIMEQGTEVDTISAATITSRGMLAAIDDAIAAENIEVPDVEFDIPDGVYTGTSPGRNEEITVEITVEDEELVDVRIISHKESDYLADPAFDLLSARLLEQQTTQIDLVAGATISSKGFLAAVGDAVDSGRVDEIAYQDGTYTGVGEG